MADWVTSPVRASLGFLAQLEETEAATSTARATPEITHVQDGFFISASFKQGQPTGLTLGNRLLASLGLLLLLFLICNLELLDDSLLFLRRQPDLRGQDHRHGAGGIGQE